MYHLYKLYKEYLMLRLTLSRHSVWKKLVRGKVKPETVNPKRITDEDGKTGQARDKLVRVARANGKDAVIAVITIK